MLFCIISSEKHKCWCFRFHYLVNTKPLTYQSVVLHAQDSLHPLLCPVSTAHYSCMACTEMNTHEPCCVYLALNKVKIAFARRDPSSIVLLGIKEWIKWLSALSLAKYIWLNLQAVFLLSLDRSADFVCAFNVLFIYFSWWIDLNLSVFHHICVLFCDQYQ